MSVPVPKTDQADGRTLPPDGVLLGIDYGAVRIGVAMCDPERRIASPLQTYVRRQPLSDAGHFAHLASEVRAVGIVVGLPLHADGRESRSSQEARHFAAWLAAVTGLPVVFWDERFTTGAAENVLIQARLTHQQRRLRRDRVAAQMILQSFLDAGCPPHGYQPPAPSVDDLKQTRTSQEAD
ncbi:MAG: Holliday junction resolvase RuvX [Gemmataceae bacterium]|nr:Holliday junction resolvase RuvX [Gemmataceae bacterium]MDW8243350.1 Holliday junction resolvase RuvX [Thermogemmata sp.]